MKTLSLILFMLFAAKNLCAQKLDLKKLDEFSVETSQTRDVKVAGEKARHKIQKYTFQFKSLGETADGYKLSCKMVRASIREEHLRKENSSLFVFNSDTIRNSLTNNSIILEPLFFLEKTFDVYVGYDGKLLKTDGIEELIQSAFAKWQIAESTTEYFNDNTAREMTATMRKIFLELPEHKIAYQSTWDNKTTGVNYKVTAIAGSLLTITGTGGDTLTARYTLNDVNGLLEDAKSHFKKVIPAYQWDETIDYAHKLIYDKHLSATVDTAWVNMAILMSSWSDAFYTKSRDIDSLKAVTYFNAHDTQFANDRLYNSQKLYLAQHLTGVKDRKYYNKLLNSMPTVFVADDPVPLVNKLSNMMRLNADSAYNVIKYYYKHPEFGSWLQSHLARNLYVGENTAISEAVFNRMLNDKTMRLQPKLTAMNAWLNAKKNPEDQTVLLKTYNKLLAMNDTYILEGNGTRYAFLTYKMLLKANKTSQANNLLKKTMQNLERYAADTLNRRRLVYKNKLAYVNYLLYQTTIKTDSVTAMTYFAKAAEYSPNERSEYSYNAFDDQDYLNSKKSYREDYITKLFANGPNETAFKLFVDVINLNVSQIDEMRKIYEKSVKNKSFADFFKDNVVSTWPDAPDFELAGIDGKTHKLSDYRGQWLVIDFWGTWCGPCRSDMPRVNKFNTDVNAGKFKGVSFLSIACHDKEDDVKSYLAGTGFGIPVAMGTLDFINAYKVQAFPTKLLISPNGKMTTALHGSTGSATVIYMNLSWENTVSKLSKLYTMN
jgi:thiol-disulfide isomerase/thioredoxin